MWQLTSSFYNLAVILAYLHVFYYIALYLSSSLLLVDACFINHELARKFLYCVSGLILWYLAVLQHRSLYDVALKLFFDSMLFFCHTKWCWLFSSTCCRRKMKAVCVLQGEAVSGTVFFEQVSFSFFPTFSRLSEMSSKKNPEIPKIHIYVCTICMYIYVFISVMSCI